MQTRRRSTTGSKIARCRARGRARSFLVCLFLLFLLPSLAGAGPRARAPGPRPGAGPRARAEDALPRTEAELRAKVATWLEALKSPAFEVREAARIGLEAYGGRAVDLLEAAREDPDPEVRRTVGLLLERLGSTKPVVPPDPQDLSGLGRISMDVEADAEEVLAALGRAHGGSFAWPEGHPTRILRAHFENAAFFDVLGDLLAQAGLRGQRGFDAAGRMVLAPAVAEREEGPWSAAGPLRVRVVEVTAVRTLGGAVRARRYVLALDLQWTPSVQLMTYQLPSKVEARDASGRAFRAGGSMRSSMLYGVGTNSRSSRLNLHLEPDFDAGATDAPADLLSELSFALRVRLRHDRREVRFDDLTEIELPATRGDAEQVTLEAVEQPDADRGPWVLDVVARLASKGARDSVLVLLQRADGGARAAAAGSRFSSADGAVRLSARAYGRWEEPPVAARVVWYGREEEGDLHFILKDVPLR